MYNDFDNRRYGYEDASFFDTIFANLGTTLFWALIILVAFLFLKSMIFIVRGKTAAVLETFGKPHPAARMPGLHFKLPWPITSRVGQVDLQIQQVRHDVDVKTKDNAFMMLPVTIQYRASDNPQSAVKAFYELENPETQIISYVLNVVRQAASDLDMQHLYGSTNQIEEQVEQKLKETFSSYGYVVINVLVDEPKPSAEVEAAFNQVIASKRLREAAENEAAAATIKLVGVAEAEKQSKKLQGEGIADMRKAIAEGLKEQIDIMKAAGLDEKESIAFLNEINRLDTLSNVAAHGSAVFLDIGRQNDGASIASAITAQQMLNKG